MQTIGCRVLVWTIGRLVHLLAVCLMGFVAYHLLKIGNAPELLRDMMATLGVQ